MVSEVSITAENTEEWLRDHWWCRGGSCL